MPATTTSLDRDQSPPRPGAPSVSSPTYKRLPQLLEVIDRRAIPSFSRLGAQALDLAEAAEEATSELRQDWAKFTEARVQGINRRARELAAQRHRSNGNGHIKQLERAV